MHRGVERTREMIFTPKDQMRTPSAPVGEKRRTGLLQRACACSQHTGKGECESCKKKRLRLQRSAIKQDAPDVAPPIVHEVLRSPGRPLDDNTRIMMERRLGYPSRPTHTTTSHKPSSRLRVGAAGGRHEREAEQIVRTGLGTEVSTSSISTAEPVDFSRVRVHTDALAARSAQAIGARAYTSGQDIVFGQDQYRPTSHDGKMLIAHELAHFVQNSRQPTLPPIRRWAIEGCTDPQEEYITDAVTRAYEDISQVLPLVNQRPTPDVVKSALWLAFRDDSESTVNLARANLQRLKQQITSTHFICTDRGVDPECKSDTLAHAPIGDVRGRVSICRPNFFDTDTSMYAQAETVIHEAAHMYLSMQDHGYFTNQGNLCAETARPAGISNPAQAESGTAGDNPAYRLENADSYGCFVHYLRYEPPEGLQTRASSYRGGNLTIEPVDDLLLEAYTQVSTPQAHRFRIGGVPPNSGFRFRWRVEAGGEVFNPASTGDGSANAFREDNQEIYFPASLLRRLERDRVSQVHLICEIQLYGETGLNRFAPPVITKEADIVVVIGPPPFDF